MKSQAIRIAMVIASLAFAASCAGNKSKSETTTAPAASSTAKAEAAPTDHKASADKKSKGKEKAAAQTEKAEKSEKNEKVSKAGSVTCKKGSESRTIAVAGVNGGCETQYTKAGEAKTVANAKAGTDYCEQVSSKIKGNLETAGYKCE